MNIIFTDSFFKSLKKIKYSTKFWKIEFWKIKYKNIKNAVWSLYYLYKPAIHFRPYDYIGLCMMMKKQISLMANKIEKNGLEMDKTRLPKIKNMYRFVELMNHFIDDNYAERCGYNYDAENYEFIPIRNGNIYEMKTITKSKNNNKKSIKDGNKLAEKEWNEMMNILKEGLRSWWD